MPNEEGTPVVAKVDEPVVVTVAVEPVPAPQPFTDLEAANKEVVKLRGENATRRVGNVELQGKIGELQKQVPTADVQAQITALQADLQRFKVAGEAGVSAELLAASDELRSATTAEGMKAATEKIARLTATPAPVTPNPTPPKLPTTPLSRDQQITAAEKAGNERESVRLKAQKLADTT